MYEMASFRQKPKVIYFLPGLGVGGVETALGRSYAKIGNTLDLQLVTLDKNVRNIQDVPAKELSWSYFLYILRQKKDTVIVTSLWRAHLFGIILKILGFPWIAFFHNPIRGHILNRVTCLISSRMANWCLFDSDQTKRNFEEGINRNLGSVIPFYFPVVNDNSDGAQYVDRDVDLVFVGRFVSQKRLDLFLQLAKYCIESDRTFKIGIAGSGSSEYLLRQFSKIYPNNVDYFGVIDNRAARQLMRRSKFIACLSDYEGMAMTVVEGIQEGCIPVVRLVGEIGNYVTSDSGIICSKDLDLQIVAGEIIKSRNNKDLLSAMNNRAKGNLKNYVSYSDAFVASVVAFIGRTFGSQKPRDN